MSEPYWVYLDFGSDHQVFRGPQPPWQGFDGPFPTWGDTDRFMRNAAMFEIEGIRSVRDGWQGSEGRKRVVEIGGDDDAV